MKTLADLLNSIVSTLQTASLILNVRVLETHNFSETQFAVKVRAELESGDTLQVRLYRNDDHTDYAYQLFRDDVPVIRWDNKEHFDSISSYPHHFHTESGAVESSTHTGEVTRDLPVVLNSLANRITR